MQARQAINDFVAWLGSVAHFNGCIDHRPPQSREKSFGRGAEKDREEPIAEVSKFRCMRAQQRFFRSGERFYAAWQRKQQPFMQRAANLKP